MWVVRHRNTLTSFKFECRLFKQSEFRCVKFNIATTLTFKRSIVFSLFFGIREVSLSILRKSEEKIKRCIVLHFQISRSDTGNEKFWPFGTSLFSNLALLKKKVNKHDKCFTLTQWHSLEKNWGNVWWHPPVRKLHAPTEFGLFCVVIPIIACRCREGSSDSAGSILQNKTKENKTFHSINPLIHWFTWLARYLSRTSADRPLFLRCCDLLQPGL